MRRTYYLTCLLVRIVMKVFYNYQIIGKDKLKNLPPCLIASNHLSYADPPLIGSIIGREVSYLAKKELFNVKLLGGLIRFYNAIPINRGIFDRKALEHVEKIVRQGGNVLMFPEGSRKSFSAKPGIGIVAHRTGIPVLPIHLENTNKIWQCLFRKKRVKIIIGDLINTKDFQMQDDNKKVYRQIAGDILNTINKLKDKHIELET